MSFQEFKELLADYLGLPSEELREETNILYDLGVDSLSLINTIIRLEQEFEVRIKPEERVLTKTLKDAYLLLVPQDRKDQVSL